LSAGPIVAFFYSADARYHLIHRKELAAVRKATAARLGA
jgi:hypothetical protein